MFDRTDKEDAAKVEVFDKLDDLLDRKTKVGDMAVMSAEEKGCNDGFDNEQDE